MKRALHGRKQFGGRVRCAFGQNATVERVQAELSYLSRFASETSLSIFYFSGHGGIEGLKLHDGNLAPEHLFPHLQGLPGKKLVLLDCCFAARFLCAPPPSTLVLTGESPDGRLYEGKVSVHLNRDAAMIQGYLTRAFVKMLEDSQLQVELKDIADKLERYYAEKVKGVKIAAIGSAIRLRSALGLKPIG